MIEPELLGSLAQLGAAGLIGWMWLSERRGAMEREAQIKESHAALMSERAQLDVLVRALEGNTRAMTALEAGQRELSRVIEAAAGDRVSRANATGSAADPIHSPR